MTPGSSTVEGMGSSWPSAMPRMPAAKWPGGGERQIATVGAAGDRFLDDPLTGGESDRLHLDLEHELRVARLALLERLPHARDHAEPGQGVQVGGGGNNVEDVGLAPAPIRRGHGLAELVDPGRRLRGISGARVHCGMVTGQHRA